MAKPCWGYGDDDHEIPVEVMLANAFHSDVFASIFLQQYPLPSWGFLECRDDPWWTPSWLAVEAIATITTDPGNATIKAEVVSDGGANTNQNAVMARSKVMRHGLGLRSGNGSGSAGPQSERRVQRCSKCQCGERRFR
ncbi:hypothetical protein E5D57_012519 [Metarhizium anisopliae]|nr:hypothetical protein E5D57_012519 [Metarhizium anisopliae]